MQIFSIKNIIPITIIGFVLGAISIGNVIQQKSIIGTAHAEDEILPPNVKNKQDHTEELPVSPPMEGLSEPFPMETYELPDEMGSNPEDPVELPAGYDDGPDPKMSALPSGMQVIRASFDASSSMQTTQAGPGPVEPPDPTDPHSERTGKGGSFKGQMGHELPPVITMGEQPEDGGLTNVTRGYQPE